MGKFSSALECLAYLETQFIVWDDDGDEECLALLRRHLEPQWTSEVPETVGAYWFYSKHSTHGQRPALMFVEMIHGCLEGDYLVVVDEYGEEDGPLEDCKGWWMPAAIPPAPANQEGRT